MQLDLHIMRFDWAGGPSGIGPGVADLTQRAEAMGVRTVSFMDHYFQMDWMAPAEDPMLEGYTALGFGAAWYEREHRGLGVPFPPTAERFERLEEAIQICLQMWSDDNGSYEGRHYWLEETLCSPMPVSTPRPRILIGGSGERKTLRLVAQYADACNIFGGGPDLAHKLDVLREHCAKL